jgi:hypothetical protein
VLSGVSLAAVSNVNNPVGLVGLPYVMWSAHFFITDIQTENISSWNGPTVHVCCFMLARASTKTFVSRVRKTAKKSSLAGSLVSQGITVHIRNDINILPLIFDNLYRTLWLPEDCCVLQLKHVGAIKPVVQLVGNKLACVRELHERCTIINPSSVSFIIFHKSIIVCRRTGCGTCQDSKHNIVKYKCYTLHIDIDTYYVNESDRHLYP